MSELFRPASLPIQELFAPQQNYTFLAGAGISIDPPSCLLSARRLVQILLELCCPADELEKITGLDKLRYELVIEGIQEHFDPTLRIMKYFEMATTPNLLHHFLAQAIQRRHYVITTNFDYLLEYALLALVQERDKIEVIVTKKDFLAVEQKLSELRHALFKIHGSKKNIITGQDTSDSLVTTLSALGKDREQGQTFALEPYKRLIISKLMEARTLVVLGYSGGDDFDITPTLKELGNISKLIWINHIPEKNAPIAISLLQESALAEQTVTPATDPLERLLGEIAIEYQKKNAPLQIYRVDANSADLINTLLSCGFYPAASRLKPKMTKNKPDSEVHDHPDFHALADSLFHDTQESRKYRFAGYLFTRLAHFSDALRCAQKSLEFSEKEGDVLTKAHAQNSMGEAYLFQGDYAKALAYFQNALALYENLANLPGKLAALSNIGVVYLAQKDYPKTVEWCQKTIASAVSMADSGREATALSNIGSAYFQQKKYAIARGYYQQALQIAERMGDLSAKAIYLNNIAMTYRFEKNYAEALPLFQDALRIGDQLGDIRGKFSRLLNLAGLYQEQGKELYARTLYEQAKATGEILGKLAGKDYHLDETPQLEQPATGYAHIASGCNPDPRRDYIDQSVIGYTPAGQMNFFRREVNIKVVYWGVPLAGKSTNLKMLYNSLSPAERGEITVFSNENEQDRTMFFNVMSNNFKVAGMKAKIRIFTITGKVNDRTNLKLILQGTGGVIFVVDSQEHRLYENLEAFQYLQDCLAELGSDVRKTPLVIQWNKRDLPHALPIAELEKRINLLGMPTVAAVATTGEGVTLTCKRYVELISSGWAKFAR